MGFTAATALVVGGAGAAAAAHKQAGAAKKAGKVQAETSQKELDTQWKMYEQNRRDMQPYSDTGKVGVERLTGGVNSYDSDSRNALNNYGALDPNAGMPGTDFARNIDPMAGQMDINTGFVDAQGNYIRPDLPDQLDFEFDPNNEVHRWRQDEAAKNVNKGLMARGKYDSRAGVNALADTSMRVTSDEIDRQYGRAVDKYGRDYGRGMDLYNIGLNEGNALYARGTDQADKNFTRRYGMGVDKYNRDMGQNDTLWNRNQGQKWNMFNALNSLSGQDYNRDLDLVKIGQGAAASTGQAAMSTGQGIANSYRNAGNNQANSIMNQGNAWGGFYSGLGQLPANALASGYYAKQLKK